MTWHELERLLECKGAYLISISADEGWVRAAMSSSPMKITVFGVPKAEIVRIADKFGGSKF